MSKTDLILNDKHFEVMVAIENGATIYGYADAVLLREVQKVDESLLTIVSLKDLEEITGETFNGAEQLPYFGAILTRKGEKLLENMRKIGDEGGQET